MVDRANGSTRSVFDVQLAGYIIYTRETGRHALDLVGVKKYDSTYEAIFRDPQGQFDAVKEEYFSSPFKRFSNAVRDIKDAGKQEEREQLRRAHGQEGRSA